MNHATNGVVSTELFVQGSNQADISHFESYAAALHDTMEHMPWHSVAEVGDMLVSAWMDGRSVVVFGNGGSSSTAQHMAADLSKNTTRPGDRRLRSMCLSDNAALFSALANDHGYAEAFSEQVAMFTDPGDVAIAISASGNSPNVLRAIDAAKARGVVTVGITGYQGGQLVHSADKCVVVPSNDIEQIEDFHMVMVHMLTSYVRKSIRRLQESQA